MAFCSVRLSSNLCRWKRSIHSEKWSEIFITKKQQCALVSILTFLLILILPYTCKVTKTFLMQCVLSQYKNNNSN